MTIVQYLAARLPRLALLLAAAWAVPMARLDVAAASAKTAARRKEVVMTSPGVLFGVSPDAAAHGGHPAVAGPGFIQALLSWTK